MRHLGRLTAYGYKVLLYAVEESVDLSLNLLDRSVRVSAKSLHNGLITLLILQRHDGLVGIEERTNHSLTHGFIIRLLYVAQLLVFRSIDDLLGVASTLVLLPVVPVERYTFLAIDNGVIVGSGVIVESITRGLVALVIGIELQDEGIERTYGGLLGKYAGHRHGAAVEPQTAGRLGTVEGTDDELHLTHSRLFFGWCFRFHL